MADDVVKVRVAVAVGPNGEWCAVGHGGYDLGDPPAETLMGNASYAIKGQPACYWLTAELPIPKRPEVAEVAAGVESGDG